MATVNENFLPAVAVAVGLLTKAGAWLAPGVDGEPGDGFTAEPPPTARHAPKAAHRHAGATTGGGGKTAVLSVRVRLAPAAIGAQPESCPPYDCKNVVPPVVALGTLMGTSIAVVPVFVRVTTPPVSVTLIAGTALVTAVDHSALVGQDSGDLAFGQLDVRGGGAEIAVVLR